MDSCLEHLDLSLHTPVDPDRRVWHFNVAFVGSCRAGKTKLLQRFVDSQFSDIYSETTETSFVSKSVSIGRHHVVFQCWDTPGSARSSGCLDGRLSQLHAIFIVFDGSRDAIADLEHWHHLASLSAARPMLVMVANKTDLGCHADSMARARDLCRASEGLVFALSVLTDEENLEVDAMMLEVGKALTERHSREVATAAAAAPPTISPSALPSPASASQRGRTATPQVAGDRSDPQDRADAVLQSPSVSQSALQSLSLLGNSGKAEGDGSPSEAADAGGVPPGKEDGKSWWSRVSCWCC